MLSLKSYIKSLKSLKSWNLKSTYRNKILVKYIKFHFMWLKIVIVRLHIRGFIFRHTKVMKRRLSPTIVNCVVQAGVCKSMFSTKFIVVVWAHVSVLYTRYHRYCNNNIIIANCIYYIMKSQWNLLKSVKSLEISEVMVKS